MDKYFARVRKSFETLLTRYSFTVVQEIIVDFCDNRFVLLESEPFLISLEKDRGYTVIHLARPPAKEWYPDNLYSGDWCSLIVALAYLGIEEPPLSQEPEKQHFWSYFKAPKDPDPARISNAVRQIEQYYSQLRDLYLSMDVTIKLMDFQQEYAQKQRELDNQRCRPKGKV